MDLDQITKLAQVAFYGVGGTVAVLSYLKAKNGLLNTINTEFHKRVLDRLAMVSDELFEEFDASSEKHWANDRVAEEIVRRIHEQVDEHKEDIISKKIQAEEWAGVPVPEKYSSLIVYLNRIKSDPFVPPAIRDKIVQYLSGRSESLMNATMAEAKAYLAGLSEGKYWDTADKNQHWFHNRVIDREHRDGYGVAANEKKVVEIREDIRKYFESYDPIKINR